MQIKGSRKLWLSLGTTLVLVFLIWATSTALAQAPDKPDVGPSLPPDMPVDRDETAPAEVEPPEGAPSGVAGGPDATMGFSYQGLLEIDGQPATGNHVFWVELWDAQVSGGLMGQCNATGTGPETEAYVDNGLFTLTLICGGWNSDVLTGRGRWLDIWVAPAGTSDWVHLTDPRQPISPAPYAFSLFPGAHIEGGVASPSAVVNVVETLGTAWDAPYAIYGEAPSTAIYGDGGGYGVRGFGDYAGVQGEGGLTGVMGDGNKYGVYGYASWPENPSEPTYGLYGYSASAAGYGVYGYGKNGAGGRFVSYNGNLIEGWEDVTGNGFDPGSDVRRFRVNWAGAVYAASYNISNPADFAEVLPAAGDPEPGDVLVVGPDGQLLASSEPYQATVVGVYSTEPAYVGGADNLGQEGYAPLAVVGLVPVKVSAENGAIAPGDLLVSASLAGHAMHGGDDPPAGTVVGKALEGLESGTGIIQMLVLLQ